MKSNSREPSVEPPSVASLRVIVDSLRAEATQSAEAIAVTRALFECLTTEWYLWDQFALRSRLFGRPNPVNTPPLREIPPALMEAFTMSGLASVEYVYGDGTYPDNWPLVYTDYEIDHYLERIGRREYYIYGMTDVWMWEAIAQFPIRGLKVVNMGSLTPWYESNCLYFGASSTTIDYNKIITLTDRITTMTVAEWERDQPTFDVAWSISSFEHDGLGMYGDPIDPVGDLKAMARMKEIVKPGGLLFLSLPVGRDKILFNNARIYGRHRLPRLMAGWEQLATFGLEPVHMDGPGHIQPVFVLRNS